MSHFTVLVQAETKEEAEEKLLPYHEYECTGIEEYIEFVPADMEQLKSDFEKHHEKGEIFNDEWIKDWSGYTKNEDGIYGSMTNPNAKWDWYEFGGRWISKFNGKINIRAKELKKRLDLPKLLCRHCNAQVNSNDVVCPECGTEFSDIYVGNNKYELSRQHMSTFAFIDKDGNWVEKADMWWWSITSNEKEDYEEIFWNWIDSLDDETTLYLVDCHI